MKTDDKIKSNCRFCNRETNHTVKAVEFTRFANEEFDSEEAFAIIQCLGCDSFAFRSEYSDSDSFIYDEHSYEPGITVRVYPIVIKSHKRLDNQYLLPKPINLMYNESLDALAADCKTLAGVGFRAVIEAVCLDKKIAGDGLEDKINNLARGHYITPSEKSRLHSIRFLGNDSVHDIKTPTAEQLSLVLQIIEHLLSSIYLMDAQVQDSLESVIANYSDFKFWLEIFIRKHDPGHEATLYKLFSKDVRRIKEHGQEFENQLVAEINAGTFTLLSIVPIVAAPGVTSPSSPVFRVL